MFTLRLYRTFNIINQLQLQIPVKNHNRQIHRIVTLYQKKSNNNENKDLMIYRLFENVKEKDKKTYLDMIRIFNERDIRKRGHVEFIYSAMKYLEEFGVHKDIEVYKKLMDVLPKGRFIPTNIFQAEFQHYPKQQQVAVDLLEMMEDNGIMPDQELESMLLNIFGKKGHAVRKLWRMAYWMPKFKNLSPWLLPNPVPDDALELAKLAIERIASVDLQSELEVLQASDVEDSIDKTWIVSSQSPKQRELLDKLPTDKSIFVEGSFRIWLREASVNYFVLRAEPKTNKIHRPTLEEIDDVSNIETPFDEKFALKKVEERSVHEQDEGIILAVAATGTSSRDSLLSWIRLLQNKNPALGSIPVVFSLTSPFGYVVPVSDNNSKTDIDKSSVIQN